MPHQPTLELADFPAVPHESQNWLHHDGRTFFLWPARDPKTNDVVQVEVEVTHISTDDVAGQLKPSRRSIELAAREMYRPGKKSIRLMRPDTYWIPPGVSGH
ncbi:hypothetical protein [Hyphomicrobium sp.]|uniref:hypothetical protein n=1 Tax=Hyphomicrobium sp. TaxID=82 RepID=UPI003F713ADF